MDEMVNIPAPSSPQQPSHSANSKFKKLRSTNIENSIFSLQEYEAVTSNYTDDWLNESRNIL